MTPAVTPAAPVAALALAKPDESGTAALNAGATAVAGEGVTAVPVITTQLAELAVPAPALAVMFALFVPVVDVDGGTAK